MITLVSMFKKIESEDKANYDSFYSSSTAEIINKSGIDDVLKSVYTAITTSIQKSLGKGSDWITDSVIDHTINISKHKILWQEAVLLNYLKN